jgi:hypothetical protein
MTSAERQEATIKLLIDSEFDKKKPPNSQNALNQPQHSNMAIFSVVSFYWISSLSVVFLNKHILSSSEHKFPYPLLVTWFQLIVALVLLYSMGVLGRSNKILSVIPPFEFTPVLVSRIWPLTFVYVMMLALNNLCLQYVEVTFYQVIIRCCEFSHFMRYNFTHRLPDLLLFCSISHSPTLCSVRPLRKQLFYRVSWYFWDSFLVPMGKLIFLSSV